MKRHLRITLGALSIAAGAVLATAAQADRHDGRGNGYQGGGGHEHSSYSGGSSRYSGGGSHFQSAPQHQQFYQSRSGRSFGQSEWQGRSVQQYRRDYGGNDRNSYRVDRGDRGDRGDFGRNDRGNWQHDGNWQHTGRGYAPGAWARNFNGSHSSNGQRSVFSSFRGRHISDLDGHDRDRWRDGGWRHSWHNGHYGWWWNTGGDWFFYDRPIYPYPDYVSDYEYDDYGGYGDYGPGNIQYYCDDPQGYYPEVSTCMDPWQPVQAQY